MTRKKQSLADTVFVLPHVIVGAVAEAMTPKQREALSAAQAGAINEIAADAARAIGRVLDNDSPRLGVAKQASAQGDAHG